jgi:hypothetical protein
MPVPLMLEVKGLFAAAVTGALALILNSLVLM